MRGVHERVQVVGPLAAPRNALGEKATDEGVIGSIWARVRQTGAVEVEKAGGAVLRSVFEVVVRKQSAETLDVTERSRFVWRGRALAIEGIEQVDPRSDYLECTCVEVR